MSFEQLSLFTSGDGCSFEDINEYLNSCTEHSVSVTLTNNKVSMISVAGGRDRDVKIRMHKGFLHAPKEVIAALGRYLRTQRRKDWGIVSGFARTIPVDERTSKSHIELVSAGKVYDLALLSAEVNQQYFNGRIKYRIGWGRGRPARKRRRVRGRYIRFGSWMSKERIIRIHPVLDDARVPVEFLQYIIYHEMLHAVVTADVKNGRSYDHSSQFRKLERSFPDYGEMKKISKHILDEMI